ncbi:MAG: A24 family peptidase, partial [Parvularculaceae bacterium]
LFAVLFLLGLVALAAIDAETGFLPDALTVPLIWLGLIANIGERFASLPSAVIGAVAGYAAFWFVSGAYRLVRGREGLGGGDAKLLAAIGAWGGWMALAPAVFFGAIAALAGILGLLMLGRRIGPETPVPFGPALCLGGAAVFLAHGVGGLPLVP